MTLTADPDYETKSSYSFTVTATDAAGNISAAQTVSLSINNLDEEVPVITSSATTAAIDENSGSGQQVYTITATDDIGVTSYGVSGTDAADFSVDSTTGVVTLTGDPDYEIKNSYEFTVTASDAASNTSTEQTVTLSINDLVETIPVITSSTAAAIDENSGAGQVVYTITASATDSGIISSYGIGGTDASHFTVNATTGEVTLTADPDYETKSSYEFTVTANDTAGNTSTDQTVTLSINNLPEPSISTSITSPTSQAVIPIMIDFDMDVQEFSLTGFQARFLLRMVHHLQIRLLGQKMNLKKYLEKPNLFLGLLEM